jgi:hypothetical protein
MRTFFIFIFCLTFSYILRSQVFFNGNFLLGTTFWGCAAETNAETVYGGSNGLNTVAEVDAAAGLCQTVSGLLIGGVYRLSYECSRRVGGCASPNPTNMFVTVSGGVLNKTDVRTNTAYALTTSAYIFTATATSHVITFGPGAGFGGSTCGMIVDNISVTISPLPIELIYFNTSIKEEGSVLTSWETASELNNDFFNVEKSTNSMDWENIATIKGGGTTNQRLAYNYTDHEPYVGISYYRLKQTDFNGTFKYSSIQSIDLEMAKQVTVFPNPSAEHILKINSNENYPYSISVFDHLGVVLFSSPKHESSKINLEHLTSGVYYLVISKGDRTIYRNKVILQ